MKINLKKITVREIFDGYKDDSDKDGAVVGMGGKLNIQPAFQRNLVYSEAQQIAVINSVKHGFPLNTIYFAVTPDGFEVLDGQQRIRSICRYLHDDYSVMSANGNPQFWHNLKPEEQEAILNYELMVYECDGTSEEKLSWFKTINIAGAVLTAQEIRNAVYAGSWLADAKRFFSKRNCAAYNLANKYLKGDVIRQDYLETAIRWIAARDNMNIEEYMAVHQNNDDAQDLWIWFQDVIRWVQSRFPEYRKEMKGVDWGILYLKYGDKKINPKETEEEIKKLMMDDDVTKKPGIYPYILTGEEKYLSIRAFSPAMKRAAYERQGGVCPHCQTEGNLKVWDIDEMEADHITPWHDGGKTVAENCQMLCKQHNRAKSGK